MRQMEDRMELRIVDRWRGGGALKDSLGGRELVDRRALLVRTHASQALLQAAPQSCEQLWGQLQSQVTRALAGPPGSGGP